MSSLTNNSFSSPSGAHGEDFSITGNGTINPARTTAATNNTNASVRGGRGAARARRGRGGVNRSHVSLNNNLNPAEDEALYGVAPPNVSGIDPEIAEAMRRSLIDQQRAADAAARQAQRAAAAAALQSSAIDSSLSSSSSPPSSSPSSAAKSSIQVVYNPMKSKPIDENEKKEEKERELKEEDESKTYENDPTFYESSAIDPLLQQPDYAEEIMKNLEQITAIVDSASVEPELNTQQLSCLRTLAVCRDSELSSILSAQEEKSSELEPAALYASLSSLVSSYLSLESSCSDLQHSEMDALRSIFGYSAELRVFNTSPLTLAIQLQLSEIDCVMELAFMLPAAYPLKQAVVVNSFIPPPFNNKSSACCLLQESLEKRAREMIGEDSVIYELVMCAKSFIESNLEIFKHSLERMEQEKATKQIRLFTPMNETENTTEIVTANEGVFTREKIETIIQHSMRIVSSNKGISEAKAKVLLKNNHWKLRATLEQEEKNKETEKQEEKKTEEEEEEDNASEPSDESDDEDALNDDYMNFPSPTLVQQSSTERISQYMNERSQYVSFLSDSSHTLTCLSCFEDFQLRELCLQSCHHPLCVPCYRRYLLSFVLQGKSFIQCPGHKCSEYVEEGLIHCLLSSSEYQKYRRWLQDSFIRLRHWKFCVNPLCNNVFNTKEKYGVVHCYCGTNCCFSCAKEGHWPVPCNAIDAYTQSKLISLLRTKHFAALKLQLKYVTGGAPIDNIEHQEQQSIETKKCPKCKMEWERNGGCNHFVCGGCGHHYCWICLKDWSSHGSSYYTCLFQDKEVKAIKHTFTDGMTVTGDIQFIRYHTEMEVLHLSKSDLLLERIAAATSDPAALNQFLTDLPDTTPSFIYQCFSFLHEVHRVLRCIHIYFVLHQPILENPPTTGKSSSIPLHLLVGRDMSLTEYFVSSLDASFIPRQVRTKRSQYQLIEQMKIIQRHAKILQQHMKTIEEQEKKRLLGANVQSKDQVHMKEESLYHSTAHYKQIKNDKKEKLLTEFSSNTTIGKNGIKMVNEVISEQL